MSYGARRNRAFAPDKISKRAKQARIFPLGVLRSRREFDRPFNLRRGLQATLLRDLEKRFRLVIFTERHYGVGLTDGLRFAKYNGTHQRGI